MASIGRARTRRITRDTRTSVKTAGRPFPVTHVLDAHAGAGTGLWGKERLVEGLMLAQRESGELEPRLVTFTPCSLGDLMREHGMAVDVLEERHRRVPVRSLPALRRVLAARSPALIHTHGYKANLIARLARASGTSMRGLVATCHAWFDETRATRLYNVLDRETAVFSDVTTVADEKMLARMPSRGRSAYIANGIPDIDRPSLDVRHEARAAFSFPQGHTVVGFLARTNASKGIPEVLEAARRSRELPIVWAIAGTGDLAEAIVAAALPNVRFLGYIQDSNLYRAAIDTYVQASHVEGLSLSLLEAMRAGLPIVATSAGSTTLAISDGVEGCIVAPGDVDALLAAVTSLATDADLARRLGTNARARFEAEFRVDRQHRDFMKIYRSVVDARNVQKTPA